MKGQYPGADGRTYRWYKNGEYWSLAWISDWTRDQDKGTTNVPQCGPRLADIDAAFAALKELQEEGEWVEYKNWRIKRNGTCPEYKTSDGWESRKEGWSDEWYCLGYATGLEDGRKEARELTETVLAQHVEWLGHSMTWATWEPIVALARKVKGE